MRATVIAILTFLLVACGGEDTHANKQQSTDSDAASSSDITPPEITSADSINIAENQIIKYQILASDNVEIKQNSFTLSGPDQNDFTIDSNTGLITSKYPADFELKSRYSIEVGASDSSDNTASLEVDILIEDIDDTPPAITSPDTILVLENQFINYQIQANDNQGLKENSYTLTGTDADLFILDSETGLLSSKTASDFETQSSYEIIIAVLDNNDNKATLTLSIAVQNMDEEPPKITSVPSLILNENQIIYYQTAATDDIAIKPGSFKLSGKDAEYFNITPDTGLISSKVAADFESKPSYNITVSVSDTSDKVSTLDITIIINDLDDSAPVITSESELLIEENQVINYQITAIDNVGLKANSYTLSGIDADHFSINTETGAITSYEATDFENKEVYFITIGVSDSSDNHSELEVVISVLDIDDTPPVISSAKELTLDENQIIHYQILASDNISLEPGSYQLQGPDAHLFDINAFTGLVITIEPGDFELQSVYSITVGVSDSSGNYSEQDVTIILNNLDEIAPEIISSAMISMDENQIISYQILATDNDGIAPDSFALSGPDAYQFTLDPINTGLVLSNLPGDFEQQETYKITVSVSDFTGNKANLDVLIKLNNLDDTAPIISSPDTLNLDENLVISYQIIASDETAIKPESFTLSGIDSDDFLLDKKSGLITSKEIGDYELKSSYVITISVSDTSGNISYQNISIHLNDIDETACNFKIWNINETCVEAGIEKLVVDRDLLLSMIETGGDVTQVYTGQITDMSLLFANKDTFNQDISGWNTQNVTTMHGMFSAARAFNQNIGDWNTSKVTDMSSMFYQASIFNQPIGNWNTSNVTNMQKMFFQAKEFNQELNSWDISKVTDISSMFQGAVRFSQDIGQWNTSQVTNMRELFSGAKSFYKDITGWDTSKVTDMSGMFRGAQRFSQNIGIWDTSQVTNMSYMFSQTSFNKDISFWDTSKVTNMARMFSENRYFNQNIGTWDTGKVRDMNHMFFEARYFNQDIGGWDTSNVTNMAGMFFVAGDFNQNLNQWDTGNVRDMSEMFRGAWDFNQAIGAWNTGNVRDMSNMFQFARVFNQPIGNWNVRRVDDMSFMFHDADSFNQPIDQWRTYTVDSMESMFSSAGEFNQPLGSWDVVTVNNMKNMFSNAAKFNQPIGQWLTLSVRSTVGMFSGAMAFRQDLSGWQTDSTRFYSSMFYNCPMYSDLMPEYCRANVRACRR